jgi:hypothetical protein
MLKLLRNVRKAYKQWQQLPPEEREQFSADVRHIRALVAELGGAKAVRFIENAGGEEVDETQLTAEPSGRPRSAVIAELQDATATLLSAMARPTAALAKGSVPTSVRLGSKAATAGFRRFGRGR